MDVFQRIMKFWWPTLVVAGLLYGQADLATVTGVVTDSAKAVIPGVKIVVRNAETGISHTVTTNQEGYFTVSELEPGHYELIATNLGFETYKETNVVLTTGGEVRVPVTLKVRSVNETSSVTADAVTLHTDNGATAGQVVTNAEIEDMPLNGGRDFTTLAQFVPGVSGHVARAVEAALVATCPFSICPQVKSNARNLKC